MPLKKSDLKKGSSRFLAQRKYSLSQGNISRHLNYDISLSLTFLKIDTRYISKNRHKKYNIDIIPPTKTHFQNRFITSCYKIRRRRTYVQKFRHR